MEINKASNAFNNYKSEVQSHRETNTKPPTQEFSIQKKTKSQSTEDEMFGNNVADHYLHKQSHYHNNKELKLIKYLKIIKVCIINIRII